MLVRSEPVRPLPSTSVDSRPRGAMNPDCCLFVCRITSWGTAKLTSIFNFLLYIPDTPGKGGVNVHVTADPCQSCCILMRRAMQKLRAAKQWAACSACQVLSCRDTETLELSCRRRSPECLCKVLDPPPFDWHLLHVGDNEHQQLQRSGGSATCPRMRQILWRLCQTQTSDSKFTVFLVGFSSALSSLPDGINQRRQTRSWCWKVVSH